MKAVAFRADGELDAVEVMDLPAPTPGEGEAVVRVRAAALNHLDIWVRKGRPGMESPMPHVLGSDAAGVVEAVGPCVEGVKPGDEVVLNPGISCGRCEFCRRGEQSLCRDFEIVGATRPGTFAEMVAVPAENLYPKPEHLCFVEAAALPLVHLTAWRMLMTRAELKPGETVLIHGIGGGVALAALQIAKVAGAEAIVTSSSDEKLRRAKEVGADRTINYAKADVAQEVKSITQGAGVDVVIDAVGAATFVIDMQVVRRGGRVVLCGVTTGAKARIDLQSLYWNQVSVLGSTMGSHEDFCRLLRAVNVTGLKPVVDFVLPLDHAKEAMRRMEEGEQFGKIVLEISGG